MDDFERWYREEHPRVFGVCLAFAGDRDRARESTDEAFARAFERWSGVSAMTAPGGWVQVVALNHLRRVLRRSQLERVWSHRRPDRSDADMPMPDAHLWAAVQRLPYRQRTAVALRFVGDLSEPEIASSMGISRGTVSSTLQRALSKLRVEVVDTDRSQEVRP